MGACCGNHSLPEYSHNNMDSQEERKFIDAQQLPSAPTSLVLSEQLEIFLSCKNLPKLDIGSPSDPFIVIYQKMDTDNTYHEIAKTEMVKDNNNPEFTKQICIDYHFEQLQLLRLDIYDADSKDLTRLSKHDYIGCCEFVLADLVNGKGCKLRMHIKDKKENIRKNKKIASTCIIRSEEIKKNHDQFMVEFECKDLEKPSWTTRPNPYLQLYRKANSESDGWLSIMRTKRYMKAQNVRWNKIKIPIQRLCNSDYGRPILIKCFHDKDDSAPVEIGECQTSLQALLDESSIALINPTKANKVTGTLIVRSTDIIKRYGFLQYVMGGMNIEMMVGIDFTGSNGNPQEEGTLHYCGAPTFESPYMRALRSVGRVIEAYDSDKQINAYGFGANINPYGEKNVSHCFNLTLTDNVCVAGIEGVLRAYMDCINKIQLYGPTNFAPIINQCAAMAASKINSQREQNYVILLMITDGIITDMGDTIDAIVNASDLALSIIIVGVGNANFEAMDKLDADDEALRSRTGVRMKRDIVQFVPFNQYRDGDIGRLAKAVLEEVPAQITGYMTMKKLHPLIHVDDMKQQSTMLGTYEGPSTIVRAGTQYVKHMSDKPVNPYYSQQATQKQEAVMIMPQQQPIVVVNQTQPLQPNQVGYNPGMVAVNPSAPTAPLY